MGYSLLTKNEMLELLGHNRFNNFSNTDYLIDQIKDNNCSDAISVILNILEKNNPLDTLNRKDLGEILKYLLFNLDTDHYRRTLILLALSPFNNFDNSDLYLITLTEWVDVKLEFKNERELLDFIIDIDLVYTFTRDNIITSAFKSKINKLNLDRDRFKFMIDMKDSYKFIIYGEESLNKLVNILFKKD